jgi:diguanylate cyclase (GGDEF)-like protein
MPHRPHSPHLQPLLDAAAGTRTQDRRIKSPLLYQLSYGGVVPLDRSRAVRGGAHTVGVPARSYEPVRAGRGRLARQAPLRVVAIGLLTFALVTVARTSSGYWLAVPAVALVGVLPLGRAGVVIGGVIAAGAALGPLLVFQLRPLPEPALAVVVPLATVVILVATKERLERQRDALRDVALSDPLTGVANRRLLMARADYEIARHSREDRSFAVVMLDLDGFKGLNDRFGHAAGDELLCDVADSLTHAIRAQDTVARLGGDEFCVLAPETDHRGVPRLNNRIARAVATATAGVESLRASSGVAVFPHDGRTAAELLHVADLRLLDAKRERGSRPRRRVAA